jgi:CRP-like cAMP-binding protein
MIPTLEKTQFLKNVPLFRGFSTMDLLIVAQIAKQSSFHAGHTLFQYNDPGDALYIILEGQVEIRNAEGHRISLIKTPQSFGEVALLDKSGRAATATCMDDCRMLMISSDDFQDILEDYPNLYKNIILILTKWLRETEAR